MIVEAGLLILGGYLLGSISPTYLVGRWLGNKDLRQYGSGTLGGSMVYEHVGRWAVVPVALFDIAKAALPAWVGLRLGLGETVAAAAGLAAAIGHNWSIFLRFTGGRGMATFVGVWLALFPLGIVWQGGLLAIGWRLGDSAPWLLAGLLTMPLLAHLLGGPDVVGPIAGAMVLLTLVKRLEGNRRPWPSSRPERLKVLMRRALFDRDITSHEEWIRQEPRHEAEWRGNDEGQKASIP
jgi:glycerol-3-phosphate acyltransferase PlsY